MNTNSPIAVVGISGIFPGAKDTARFWHNISNGIDTTRAVAPDRWINTPDTFLSTRSTPDKAYSQNLCAVDPFDFDPEGFGLPSELLTGLEPQYQWVLQAGRAVISEGVCTNISKDRIGVILAAIVLPTKASSRLARQLYSPLIRHQLTGRTSTRSSAPFAENMLRLSGRVISLPASLLAAGLNLHGGAVTLDAACASSLYAVALACDQLQQHRTDAMITGGLSRPDSLYTQIGFSQLQALSPSGRCAPFDRSADGLIVGEGAGLMMLKRLDDAVRDNDTIHGVIRGIGLSNDMRGNLLAPESNGQLRAMRQAYANSGWMPEDVDLIECHGAGTPVGDATEIGSLVGLWKDRPWQPGQCAIGSIKSMIGHLLTAAGAAGMIKTLLAMKHKQLPPSLKFRSPPVNSPLVDSPFRVQTHPAPWKRRSNGVPRRAAVSAFGFGGINAHLLIEEWREKEIAAPTKSDKRKGSSPDALSLIGTPTQKQAPSPVDEVVIVGAAARIGAADSLDELIRTMAKGRSILGPVPSHRFHDPSGRCSGPAEHLPAGAFMTSFPVKIGEFQIPPAEIGDILPQQLLMLKVAGEAMGDAGMALRQPRDKMGVIVGIGFDYEATNFHLRWAIPGLVEKWLSEDDRHYRPEEIGVAVQAAVEGTAAPLTASRTLGALGGIVASRIAREFKFGGPSFVVSSEEASGLNALQIGVRMIQSGQTDQVLVGAVDLNGDERNLISRYDLADLSDGNNIHAFDQQAGGTLPGEGALALILKAKQQALADGDRIYAVVKGMGFASGGSVETGADSRTYCQSMNAALEQAGLEAGHIGLLEMHGSGIEREDHIEIDALESFFSSTSGHPHQPAALGTTKPVIGHTGAAAGLASVLKAAVCLQRHILMPVIHYRKPLDARLETLPVHMPHRAQYWCRNRVDGQRVACVGAMTFDGNCAHVILEAVDQAAPDYGKIGIEPVRQSQAPALFRLSANGPDQLAATIDALEGDIQEYLPDGGSGRRLNQVAGRWARRRFQGPTVESHRLALVAENTHALSKALAMARNAVRQDRSLHESDRHSAVTYFSPNHRPDGAKVAFVYPGSGNHYIGMGRELGLWFPDVLDEMDRQTERLMDQLLPRIYMPWRSDWKSGWQTEASRQLLADPLHPIFGQVLFGGLMTKILSRFHLSPTHVIGYSLGESAALFANGAWPDRGAMLNRLRQTDLFKTELAGPCNALRSAWQIEKDKPVRWRVAVIQADAETVRSALADIAHVRLLIVNSPVQCVIGGLEESVALAIEKTKKEAVYLDGVVTVHCDAAAPVAEAYKALHRFPITPVDGVTFYSCANAAPYTVMTSDAAAQSILDQALNGFDFTRTVERAYQDGVRLFVELGPHNSCSRMIAQTLADRPHLALAANRRGENEVLSLHKCLAALWAAGVPIDMDILYPFSDQSAQQDDTTSQIIHVPIGGPLVDITPPDFLREPPVDTAPLGPVQKTGAFDKPLDKDRSMTPPPAPVVDPAAAATTPTAPDQDQWFTRFQHNIAATAQAHEQFLELSRQLTREHAEMIDLQARLIRNGGNGIQDIGGSADGMSEVPKTMADRSDQPPQPASDMPVVFTRAQCMEFAIGKVGNVLGPDFEIIDTYPVRVRLPDEPLMLVDRIVGIEGEKGSLKNGRLVTEHDVQPGTWYLDGGRAPVCISVEAGQADLFLSAYLGIDHKVKGKRSYRLLDAVVQFHRGLPRPGETIRYDIRIDKFVRQGDTYMFFFRFEGTIGQEPLISMRDGCAGFFTAAEVANSGGILLTDEVVSQQPGTVTGGYAPLVEIHRPEAYSNDQLDALRRGDLTGCFGSEFTGKSLAPQICLPGGRMRLIHRVTELSPKGGRFGLGRIIAEADIRPDDWFLTCHFMDDMVMPGTLMYECCAHTLRVLVQRMGWITDRTDVCYEPVVGQPARLKCRGPVTPQTRIVTYQVDIKQIGYNPEPYVIADALMSADGHPIVFFEGMSMKMTGVSQNELMALWSTDTVNAPHEKPGEKPSSPSPLYTRERILAFATGNPSEAFGQPYAVFDRERVIARLPGPPYCFMDRITHIEPSPWQLAPGGWVTAQYDVPADAWYFDADRSGTMPFCVLLEIALQPCGWLAAYAGSALRSEKDLKFRNLGGRATLHRQIWPEPQTLTMRTRMTKVSEAADMIIEHFDFEVLCGNEPVYTGNTYFGFFTHSALAQQVGLRENRLPASIDQNPDPSAGAGFTFSNDAPVTPDEAQGDPMIVDELDMPAKAIRMIDTITARQPESGPHGLGHIQGGKTVDPEEWFFKAHFYQDPVCPGSLGIESFLQLLRYEAIQRWPQYRKGHRLVMATGRPHQWQYRGQVTPDNRKVRVDAVITETDQQPTPGLCADGWLQVDGLQIYYMKNFAVRLEPL